MSKMERKIFNKDTDLKMSDLDIDSEPENVDEDTCDETELGSIFTAPYHLLCEQSISLKKNYILHIAATRSESEKTTVALGVSDNTCFIYSLDNNGLNKVANISGHKESITGLAFDPTDENLLYSSSVDATIKLWDLRSPDTCASTFKEQEGVVSPILSFDVTSSGQFLCGGTEHIEGDSFLLFWDARSSKLLGGYWESHTDDITQVKFHPRKQNVMTTGSTDGLINVFNIGHKDEYEALQYSYNTESSVQQLGWFKNKRGKDAISCITHTNDLQLWDVEESEKIAEFTRENITKSLQRKSVEDCYVVNTHQNKNNELVILAGSNAGKGECLRTLCFEENKLKPLSRLQGNKQIVRCSWVNNEDEHLLTAGEAGILTVWKPGQSVPSPSKKEKAIKSKLKSTPHKTKPY